MFKGLGNLADMAGLMKKVMEMKSKVEEIKAALANEEVEGTAGGGMVRVRMTGAMEVSHVAIERDLINPAEPEVLESLTKAAFNDALAKTHALVKERMKEASGGLDIPGL